MAQAQRIADDAARAKGRLLVNMSHGDVRTPMITIIGTAQLLARTQLDQRQGDYLHHIDVASQHLLGLLSDVLNLSKIEPAAWPPIESSHFALEQMCQNVCRVMASDAAGRICS